jgi:hypothetical protein
MPRTYTLSREVCFLFTICMLDTLSSAWLFQHNLATEANPLLVHFANAGTLPFLSAKMATFIPTLMIAEWYGKRRPEFIYPLLRWVGALYVGIYLLLVGAQFLG